MCYNESINFSRKKGLEMKLRKLLAALLTIAVAITSFAACSGDSGNTDTADTTTTAGEVEPLAVPDDLNTVVASVATDTDADFFNIKFSDFYNEYLFYMNRQGIDETASANEATCAGYRANIIQYQTLERVILRIADEMGVGRSSLTETELAAINTSVQEAYTSWCDSYEEEAKALLPEGYTDDDLYNKEYELFSAFLAKSNLTPDAFVEWETSSTVQQKLYDLVVKDLSVAEDEIDKFITEKTAAAKDAWENDLATYESTYTSFFVPEGTRVVEQIYIAIDSDTLSEITAYRDDGDDTSADKLVEDALKGLKTEVDAAKKALDDGGEWDTVQATYNDDTAGNDQTYVVYPKSTTVSQEIIDAAVSIENVGEYCEPLATDYGYYIFKYTKKGEMSDDDMKTLRSSASDYLLEQKQNALITEKVKEWTEKYKYDINYDLIGVTTTAETTTAAGTTTTAAETTAATTAETATAAQ